jgi:mannose-P-dolichol utilization defect protein 1
VNDPLILYGYVAGFALNLVLALQVLYYWNASPAKKQMPEIRVQSEKGEPVPLATGSQVKSPSTRRRA